MKVLYVVGTCLTRNTSANMSHNGYVQGLLENGCEVDILMAKSSWGQEDKELPIWKEATYYTFDSENFKSKLQKKFTHTNLKKSSNTVSTTAQLDQVTTKLSLKTTLRKFLKKIFYIIFPNDALYPLEKVWIQNAIAFKNKKHYDLVISNSSPTASHRMVEELIKKKHIFYTRWIQIWEDPWFSDLYGKHKDNIKEEEHRLLQIASEVYYVSPLTLHYQKQLFPDCANKLKCIPLPALQYENKVVSRITSKSINYGYFGDYYKVTRNLQPFYDALVASDENGKIYGDTDLNLKSTEKIVVKSRVTLDILAIVQANTDVLVHLCNLRGGQIPGKIYHYSVTKKPILFILDGSEEEIKLLKKYFAKYNRYIFCENNMQSIMNAMKYIKVNFYKMQYNAIEDFKPQQVVKQIL